jgi:hypothetical protein
MEYIGGEDAAADTLNGIDLPLARRQNACSSACSIISRSCWITTAFTATFRLTISCTWDGEITLIDFPAGIRAAAEP